MTAYIFLLLALPVNLLSNYFVKSSQGMTILWPSLGLICSILLAQLFISKAINSGMGMAIAFTTLTLALLIGTALVGWIMFGEKLTLYQLLGFLLAIIGIVIMSIVK